MEHHQELLAYFTTHSVWLSESFHSCELKVEGVAFFQPEIAA